MASLPPNRLHSHLGSLNSLDKVLKSDSGVSGFKKSTFFHRPFEDIE